MSRHNSLLAVDIFLQPTWSADEHRWQTELEAQVMDWAARVEDELNCYAVELPHSSWPSTQRSFACHVQFGEFSQPWVDESAGIETAVVLFFPVILRGTWPIKQAASAILRTAGCAMGELHPELEIGDVFRTDIVPTPLIDVSARPRAGARSRWHRDPNVDAFCKGSRLIGDLGLPSIQESRWHSAWPTLELVPLLGGAGIHAIQDGLAFEVGLPQDFWRLRAEERAAFILDRTLAALELRAVFDEVDASSILDRFQEMVVASEFQVHHKTPLAIPSEDGSRTLQIEYQADLDGAAYRAVVQEGNEVATSAWQPGGPTLAAARTLIPYAEYGWDGNTAWWAPDPFNSNRRARFTVSG